jgi:DNA-binding NarL/FixJ family response regulator
MIRVMLVDDQHLMRGGLRMMLETQPDIEVAGEASDGREAIELAHAARPDVVLMDIRMPGMDGLTATREITGLPDPPKVVVLTTFGEEEYVYRALRAGAVGFLLKDSPPEDLVSAVRKAHDGLAVLDPAVTGTVIASFTAGAPPSRTHERIKGLTGRELEVLACLGEGLSNADIALRLHLSETTVKSHVSHVMDKLECANRTQAAILAHEAGIVAH